MTETKAEILALHRYQYIGKLYLFFNKMGIFNKDFQRILHTKKNMLLPET
jgi:hypothetical protein